LFLVLGFLFRAFCFWFLNPKPEIRNLKLLTRNSKLETRNLKPNLSAKSAALAFIKNLDYAKFAVVAGSKDDLTAAHPANPFGQQGTARAFDVFQRRIEQDEEF